MTISANDMEILFDTLPTLDLGVSFRNSQVKVSNLPTLTAIPTYFEFTGLNVNDSSVSRLVQNTTGSPVYIKQINFFHTDSDADFDHDKWITSNTCQHNIDISSSNNNYPTDSQREFLNASTTEELMSRYDARYYSRGPFAQSDKNAWINVYLDPPILCENNNYVRLFKNGNTSFMNSYRICVLGYY